MNDSTWFDRLDPPDRIRLDAAMLAAQEEVQHNLADERWPPQACLYDEQRAYDALREVLQPKYGQSKNRWL